MYNMRYSKHPVVVATVGALINYLYERFDCYINARKTSSLNRRTTVVFLILIAGLYFITMEEKTAHSDIFTDIGNF